MTAFEELQDGTVGGATLELLVRLVRQVGATSSFPPPEGFRAWSADAAYSYLADLLVAKNGSGFIVQCAVKAHDQASLERLLLAAIRNALIDEAKATSVGRLRRRIEGLLTKDARFVNARKLLGQDGWTLPENGSTIWPEDLEALRRLVANVEVDPIERLNRGGPTPAGPRRSLLTLSFEALRRAGGAIRTQALSRLLVERFELDLEPEAPDRTTTGQSSAIASDPATARLARRYLVELSDEERAMLRDPAGFSVAVAAEPAAAALQLRLRAWAGSEIGRDAVGLLLTWCSSEPRESGRQ